VRKLVLAIALAPELGLEQTSPERELLVNQLWLARRGTGPVLCVRCAADILEDDDNAER
jgi:hypothetical protein